MGTFFLTTFAVFAGLIWFLVWAANKEAEAKATRAAAAAETERANQEARRAFVAEELGGNEPFDCRLDGKAALLASEQDDDGLRIILLADRFWPKTFEVIGEDFIRYEMIRAVAYEQDDVVETYTRTVVTPVATQKKKSAIGRGLVGGVLLGPAGLILGAASGISPETKIVQTTSKQQDTRVVKGKPTVLLTLHAVPPFKRLQFDKADDARAWAMWIGDKLSARR